MSARPSWLPSPWVVTGVRSVRVTTPVATIAAEDARDPRGATLVLRPGEVIVSVEKVQQGRTKRADVWSTGYPEQSPRVTLVSNPSAGPDLVGENRVWLSASDLVFVDVQRLEVPAPEELQPEPEQASVVGPVLVAMGAALVFWYFFGRKKQRSRRRRRRTYR